ncbi:tautomerase family protein [Anaeromyxobacter sp. Red801]|uniref:tautomerase family protein n=1 Tax=Anaeromyxobacter sp. Red801 TaxID=3411632 RepID=UPI003B9F770F
MPFISIRLSTPTDLPVGDPARRQAALDALAARVAARVSGSTARLLGKREDVTSVAVSYVEPGRWFVGGPSLASQRRSSFFVECRITDGTNDKDEKAAWVREVFDALGELVGEAHPESYVHVHDVRGDAYGYGGVTQERRYVEGRAAPRPAGDPVTPSPASRAAATP